MKKLTLLFIALMCIGLTINAQVNLNTGLSAHYPFNGNANDQSGNGNHGTVNDATLGSDRFDNKIVPMPLTALAVILNLKVKHILTGLFP